MIGKQKTNETKDSNQNFRTKRLFEMYHLVLSSIQNVMSYTESKYYRDGVVIFQEIRQDDMLMNLEAK